MTSTPDVPSFVSLSLCSSPSRVPFYFVSPHFFSYPDIPAPLSNSLIFHLFHTPHGFMTRRHTPGLLVLIYIDGLKYRIWQFCIHVVLGRGEVRNQSNLKMQSDEEWNE